MSDSQHSPAITLPFTKQEYACVWRLPKASRDGCDTETKEVPGTLNLEGSGHPSASFFGDLPIEYDKDRGAELPQTKDFDSLTASLSNGAHAALLNGWRTHWIHSGYGNGAFAILSRRSFNSGEVHTYKEIQFQIEGLDEITDFSPTDISGPFLPFAPAYYKATEDQCYTITIDRKNAEEEWRIDRRLFRGVYEVLGVRRVRQVTARWSERIRLQT